MMPVLILLAILLSVQVQVAPSPVRRVRASWVVKVAYHVRVLLWRREMMRQREQRVFRKFHMRDTRFRRVKFNATGGLSIGPVWYAKPKVQRLIVDTVLVIVMLLVSTYLLSTPIAVPMAVINSAGTGAWATGATWAGGTAPGTLDDAVVLNTHTVTLGADALTGSVAIQSGGTIVMATFTLTCDDENAAGYAFDNDGTLTANTGTLTFTYAGTTLVDFAGAAGNPYRIVLNNASLVLTMDTALTVNRITITAGELTTSANNYSLTSSNACVILVGGTLSCNGSTIILSGTGTANGYSIENAGTFNGGTGTHTIALSLFAGVSSTMTSGTLTWNGNFQNITGTVFHHNNGTIVWAFAGDSFFYTDTPLTLYNFTINDAACAVSFCAGKGAAITIDNNFTTTAGSFSTWNGVTSYNLTVNGATSITGTLTCNASSVTFNGAVTVNNGGTLGGNTAWTCATRDNLTVSAGGAIDFGTGTGHTIYGVSAANLKTLAGGGTIDFGTATIAIKWMDVTFNMVTGGSGVTITLTGCDFSGALTVTTGDVLIVTDWIKVRGTLTLVDACNFQMRQGYINPATAVINAGSFIISEKNGGSHDYLMWSTAAGKTESNITVDTPKPNDSFNLVAGKFTFNNGAQVNVIYSLASAAGTTIVNAVDKGLTVLNRDLSGVLGTLTQTYPVYIAKRVPSRPVPIPLSLPVEECN